MGSEADRPELSVRRSNQLFTENDKARQRIRGLLLGLRPPPVRLRRVFVAEAISHLLGRYRKWHTRGFHTPEQPQKQLGKTPQAR